MDVEHRRAGRRRCRRRSRISAARAGLVRALHVAESAPERRVVGERREPAQSSARSVTQPGPDVLADERRQTRDSPDCSQRRGVMPLVMLTILSGRELVEVREDRPLHELGVDRRHAVDAVAADDREMRHAQPAVPVGLVDDRHAPQPVDVARIGVAHLLEEPVVDLVDDLQVARQQPARTGRRATSRAPRASACGSCTRTSARVMSHARSHVDAVDVDEHPHQLGDARSTGACR